jgi:hypothetical protein
MKYTAFIRVVHHKKNLTGHMQVNRSNENYYLSDDTVIVTDAGGHQSNHMTGGPPQAKLLSPQICTEEKRLHYSGNKFPCIDKGINHAMCTEDTKRVISIRKFQCFAIAATAFKTFIIFSVSYLKLPSSSILLSLYFIPYSLRKIRIGRRRVNIQNQSKLWRPLALWALVS